MGCGYRCPECGQGEEFLAYGVVLSGPVVVTEDGWDWTSGGQDSELSDGAVMKCVMCGREGGWREFVDERG